MIYASCTAFEGQDHRIQWNRNVNGVINRCIMYKININTAAAAAMMTMITGVRNRDREPLLEQTISGSGHVSKVIWLQAASLPVTKSVL